MFETVRDAMRRLRKISNRAFHCDHYYNWFCSGYSPRRLASWGQCKDTVPQYTDNRSSSQSNDFSTSGVWQVSYSISYWSTSFSSLWCDSTGEGGVRSPDLPLSRPTHYHQVTEVVQASRRPARAGVFSPLSRTTGACGAVYDVRGNQNDTPLIAERMTSPQMQTADSLRCCMVEGCLKK